MSILQMEKPMQPVYIFGPQIKWKPVPKLHITYPSDNLHTSFFARP